MSEKYKQEIEEILQRAEEVMPGGPSKTPQKRSEGTGRGIGLVGRLARRPRLKMSASKVMLASFAVLLLAFILSVADVGSVVPLVAAGLVLFVIGYALFFIRSGGSYEKRWRGKVVEDQPSAWGRVKRWLSK